LSSAAAQRRECLVHLARCSPVLPVPGRTIFSTHAPHDIRSEFKETKSPRVAEHYLLFRGLFARRLLLLRAAQRLRAVLIGPCSRPPPLFLAGPLEVISDHSFPLEQRAQRPTSEKPASTPCTPPQPSCVGGSRSHCRRSSRRRGIH
jgi:hypothetical protein